MEVVTKKIIVLYSMALIGVMLIFIAGERFFGEDFDYLAYQKYFNTHPDNVNRIYEPFFIVLHYLNWELLEFRNITHILYFLATLTVLIKFAIIYRFSQNPLLSTIVYIGFFFMLHEYTQIRVALAMCIVIYACHYLGYWKKYFALIFLAACFHFSIFSFLIFGPIAYYFRTTFLLLSVIISIGLAVVMGAYSEKINVIITVYASNSFGLMGPVYNFNMFNLLNLFYTLVAVFSSILFIYGVGSSNKYFRIYVNLTLLGSILYYTLGALGLPVLAYRLSYTMFPFMSFSLACLSTIIAPRVLPAAIIIILSAVAFAFQVQNLTL